MEKNINWLSYPNSSCFGIFLDRPHVWSHYALGTITMLKGLVFNIKMLFKSAQDFPLWDKIAIRWSYLHNTDINLVFAVRSYIQFYKIFLFLYVIWWSCVKQFPGVIFILSTMHIRLWTAFADINSQEQFHTLELRCWPWRQSLWTLAFITTLLCLISIPLC